MRDATELEHRLGVSFKDQLLLVQALTHASFVAENPEWPGGHNERLEYLGDAVLELSIRAHLFREFPDMQEGGMTQVASGLVCTRTLSEIGTELGLCDFLFLGNGQSRDAKGRYYLSASTFEALLGALYLDQGLSAVQSLIERLLVPKVSVVLSERRWEGAKSKFQRLAQARMGITPSYKVLEECADNDQREFVCAVYIGEKVIATGRGSSKHQAEEAAATTALRSKKVPRLSNL